MSIVYNAEPLGYSEKAKLTWLEKNFKYQNGSWDDIDRNLDFPGVEILIVRLKRYVDRIILDKFPDMKVLISATTGHDHLDINQLEKHGVKLISLRGHDEFLRTIPSTAEHTWALIMTLIRNIPDANDHVKTGIWNRDLFRGYQLKGKTLGIVGYGRTGKKVADYANVFGMKVRFYDPYVSELKEAKVNELNDLMKQSDILSFHLHLNEETQNLLNNNNLSYLKSGAYLINTSRGLIWDEYAIVKAIQNNQIKGIATDVLNSEFDSITKSPLWQAQQKGMNIIITPHIGGATWDAMWACEEFIISFV